MITKQVAFSLSVLGLTFVTCAASAQTQTRPPIQQPGSMTSPYNSDWARPLPQTGPQIQQQNRGTQPPINQPGMRQNTPRPQGGIINN
jgi:hypothetical protein